MSNSTEKNEAEIVREEQVQLPLRRLKAFTAADELDYRRAVEAANRKKKGASDEKGKPDVNEQFKGPPVGLAISGGGIRAASTALGMLQSLYRTGLLRHFDYLSTVSGGTYAGALLTAEIHSQTKPIDFTPEEDPLELGAARLPLLHQKNTPQPPIINGLSTAAESLKQPIRFLSRHLWGLLTVNAFLLSGLISLAALAAWGMRWFDDPDVTVYLAELGFQSDVARAMFPATMAFTAWAVTSFLSAMMSRRFARFPPISARAYLLFVFLLALGIVLLFSTANLNFEPLEKWANKDWEFGNRIRALLGWVGQVLAVIMAVAILPLFRVNDIIRSGTKGSGVQRFLFNVVGTTALLSVPLLFFYFISAENFSGLIQPGEKDVTFSRGSLRQRDRFLEQLSPDQDSNNDRKTAPQAALLQEVAGKAKSLTEHLANGFLKVLSDSGSNKQSQKIDLTAARKEFKKTFADQLRKNLEGTQESKKAEKNEDNGEPTKEPSDKDKVEDQKIDALISKLKCIKNSQAKVDSRNILLGWFPFSMRRIFSPENLFEGVKLRENAREHQTQLATAINQILHTTENGDSKLFDLFHDDDHQSTHDESVKSSALTLDRPISDSQFPDVEQERDYLLWSLSRKHKHDMKERDPKNTQELPEAFKLVILRWNMLRLVYGRDLIYPPTEIFASVVVEEDQKSRLRWFGWSALVFLTLGLVISVNTTTNHGFYRDQIASRWIGPHSSSGDFLPLAEVDTLSKGGPHPLINTTVNLGGRQANITDSRMERLLLTPKHSGCDRLGFSETSSLLGSDYSLADALALSGAAVSPMNTENILVRMLLIITNMRLGQWLPNPSSQTVQSSLSWPMPLLLLWQHLTTVPKHRKFLFVSDGGHHENTGIESLLVRRCRLIVAADFSEDGSYEFADFRKLCLRASQQLGVQLFEHPTAPIARLRPAGGDHRVPSHVALFRIHYPPPSAAAHEIRTVPQNGDAWLVLVKPGLCGNEPAGLLECGRGFAKFPNDPTGDQLFEETRFMAYRQLGEHLGEELLRFFTSRQRPPSPPAQSPKSPSRPGPDSELNVTDSPLWLSDQWKPQDPVPTKAQEPGEPPLNVPSTPST